MKKVLIVDDHKSICDSLTFALEGTGDFTVVGRLSNAGYTDIYCEKISPDLIFMDVCTEEGSSGLEATVSIRKKYPDIKIIVMSGFDEYIFEKKAKEADAHAFIYKNSSLLKFVEAAGEVMK